MEKLVGVEKKTFFVSTPNTLIFFWFLHHNSIALSEEYLVSLVFHKFAIGPAPGVKMYHFLAIFEKSKRLLLVMVLKIDMEDTFILYTTAICFFFCLKICKCNTYTKILTFFIVQNFCDVATNGGWCLYKQKALTVYSLKRTSVPLYLYSLIF